MPPRGLLHPTPGTSPGPTIGYTLFTYTNSNDAHTTPAKGAAKKAGNVLRGGPFGRGKSSTEEIIRTAAHVVRIATPSKHQKPGAYYLQGSGMTAAQVARRVAYLYRMAGGYTPAPSTIAARIGEELARSDGQRLKRIGWGSGTDYLRPGWDQ